MEIKEVIKICQKIKNYCNHALIVSETSIEDYIEDKTTPWNYNHKEKQIIFYNIDTLRCSVFVNKGRINIIKKNKTIFIGKKHTFHKNYVHGIYFNIIKNNVICCFGWNGKTLA